MFRSSRALGLDHCKDAVVFDLKRSAELGLSLVNLVHCSLTKGEVKDGGRCSQPASPRIACV